MMHLSLFTAIDSVILSVFLYTLVAFRDHRRRRGLPYPPGPTSLPVIGNLWDLPKLSSWSAYADMSKKYGKAWPTLRVSSLKPSLYQAMSYAFKFSAKQSWSCARWQTSRTYLKSAESCTQIEPRFRSSRCEFSRHLSSGYLRFRVLRMDINWTLPSARRENLGVMAASYWNAVFVLEQQSCIYV